MIRPTLNRIVIRPSVRVLSTVLIVNNSKEPFNEGTVVAIGPDVTDVQVGDFVKYGNGDYCDWPTHTVDGEQFQIITDMDIAAVVEA